MIPVSFPVVSNHLDLILINLESGGFTSSELVTIATKIYEMSLFINNSHPGLFDMICDIVKDKKSKSTTTEEVPNATK